MVLFSTMLHSNLKNLKRTFFIDIFSEFFFRFVWPRDGGSDWELNINNAVSSLALWRFGRNYRIVAHSDLERSGEYIQAVTFNTQYKDFIFNLQYLKYESYNI